MKLATEQLLNHIDNHINKLHERVSFLENFSQANKSPGNVNKYLEIFNVLYKEYLEFIYSNKDLNSPDIDSDSILNVIVQKAIQLFTSSLQIMSYLEKNNFDKDPEVSKTLHHIHKLNREWSYFLNTNKVKYASSNYNSNHDLDMTHLNEALKNQLFGLQTEIETSEKRLQKNQSNTTIALEDIEKRSQALESEVKMRLEAVDNLYYEAQALLESKQNSVDDLIGTISEKVIAGDYETSAEKERKAANLFRIASLICMFTIASLVGLSFYETTIDTFKWENSLFRFIFSVLLSVPAAYLARESAKHRRQQYAHLQTSLDLKAIGPYSASLPLEEQHRLKSEIASRIFAPKDFSSSNTANSSIGNYELLSKLIDKLEIKPK